MLSRDDKTLINTEDPVDTFYNPKAFKQSIMDPKPVMGPLKTQDLYPIFKIRRLVKVSHSSKPV